MRKNFLNIGHLQVLTAALCAGAVSACSPSSLFGNHTDKGVQNFHSYHQVNTSCSQMDLSRSRLDLASARALVNCLDSQGALGGFAQLVKAMKDDELQPFINSINRSFLDRPENLFKVERMLDDLKARGELDGALAGLGALLQSDELITRAVSIFRHSYVNDDHVDPGFLHAVERLSRELTEDRVKDAMDLGLILSDARAFASLWQHIDGARPLSPAVAEGLVAYSKSGSRLGRQLIDLLIDGSLLQFTDAIVPDDSDGIRDETPRWSSVLNASLANEGQIAGRMGGLLTALSQPIPCMQGSRALRYPPMDMIRELTSLPPEQARTFIVRERFAELYLSYPLCSFPAEAATGYQAMVSLASTAAIEPMADLLRAAYQTGQRSGEPVVNFFLNSLQDPGFQKLLPAMSELEARGAWEDLLLLSTAPRLRDHAQIVDLLKVLVEPLPGTPSSSIYDVVVKGLTQVEPSDLTALLKSFQATKMNGLASAFRGLRAAYYVNDAHPLLDLLRDSMAHASENTALIDALLKASARPEFQASIRELSRMGADGRLKDLFVTTMALFDRYAARGQSVVHALAPGASAPGMRYETRHRLAAANLSPLPPPPADFGVCSKVDFSIGWDQAAAPGFEEQFRSVSACINSDGKYSELSGMLQMLTQERTERAAGAPAPRTIHALLIEAYNTFRFTAHETSMLADRLLTAVRDGRVTRAMQSVPILVHHSVIRPLVDIAAPLIRDMQSRLGLRRLGLYGATALRRDDLQKVVAYVDDLYNEHPTPRTPGTRSAYDHERILRWISNKECASLPAAAGQDLGDAKKARLAAILDEYENADVNDGPLTRGKLRRSWTTAELKTELDPIFKKLADIPGNGAVARALLHFAARFNDPKQYEPGYLEKWLRKRANDRRIISYIYQGETIPRVRLVNGLDRLSIILLNSDIFAGAPIDMNFGMQFLANIAEAWGDVPFEQRPAEIQKKFPKDGPHPKHCPTLAEAVADIVDTANTFYQLVGFPKIPNCAQVADANDSPEVQAAETSDPTLPPPTPDNPWPADPEPGSDAAQLQLNMFNIAETLSVLQENVDDGGLKVMRDLFFDLYYTGPAANQDAGAGLKNNLSVVSRLVKVGLLRQVGTLIADTRDNDPVIHAFFQALIDGSASSEIGGVVESLLGIGADDPDQKLIWNVLDEIIKLKSPEDIATAKAIGFNGMAAIHALGRARTPDHNELFDPLLHALRPILARNNALLARHTDLVGDLATWRDGADFARALAKNKNATRGNVTDLLQDVVSDPQRGLDLMAMIEALDSSPQGASSLGRLPRPLEIARHAGRVPLPASHRDRAAAPQLPRSPRRGRKSAAARPGRALTQDAPAHGDAA